MSALHLTLTTPLAIVLDDPNVTSFRGEDASGAFGLLPGHADFLTVMPAGVIRWRGATGPWHFCALRGGVLSLSGGSRLQIACREAIRSESLETLHAEVSAARAAAREAARSARTQGAKLQARAIRHLMRELAAGGDAFGLDREAKP